MDASVIADFSAVPSGFAVLGLSSPIARAVAELGYELPTPVQEQCIPHLLAGRDLLGQAQTGTGKTAAFALPLLSRLEPSDSRQPQVLVLTPTRELALQVAEAFQRYAQYLPDFHVAPIYGGQSYNLQIRQLRRQPQVIVGTPGRVMDHIRRGTLQLDTLRALVLDEADEMLNLGFAEDIDWILERCPRTMQRALFSATMPEGIKQVARAHLNDPVEVRVRAATATVETIEQSHCLATRFHKLDMLTRLLEVEPFDGMLIFVRTKNATLELADKLKAHGFAAEPLNGDMNQELRERTIARLREGTLDILIATDVAARGLDVERISHVVNYDIPTDPLSYVHRIGRTGRAGRVGRAILLVEPRERGLLRAIERAIRRPIPAMEPPSAALLSATRIERFVADLRRTLAEQDLDFFQRLITDLARKEDLSPLDIAAALCFQLQRERPLEVRDPEPPPREQAMRHGEARDERAGGRAARPRSRYDSPREEAMLYRIEVGHRDGVGPREIVGAIANEAGLEGRHIGRIEIRDDHSLVELPAGMPPEVFQHLKRVYVRGQALRIRPLDELPGRNHRPRYAHDDGEGRLPRAFDQRPRGTLPRAPRERSWNREEARASTRPARRMRREDDEQH